MAVERAMETSKNWYETARIAASAGIYSQALYSLEMSVEIALKAVLISLHVEVPKAHDIRKVVRVYIAGNKSLPHTFLNKLDNILEVFESLLRMRSMVGYGFEGVLDKEELQKQVNVMLPQCSDLVDECEKAIQHIDKKSRNNE
ncbi:MAG: HEPN domain-containing protein [Thermoplasmataceae archaeon]